LSPVSAERQRRTMTTASSTVVSAYCWRSGGHRARQRGRLVSVGTPRVPFRTRRRSIVRWDRSERNVRTRAEGMGLSFHPFHFLARPSTTRPSAAPMPPIHRHHEDVEREREGERRRRRPPGQRQPTIMLQVRRSHSISGRRGRLVSKSAGAPLRH
jgi:hypothetical protein